MKIISLIDDSDVIKKILKHLGLWLPKRAPAPKANAPPKAVLIDYLDSQIPYLLAKALRSQWLR
jgi:hypothetical protein